MGHLLIIERPWKYRDRRRGVQVLEPGRYFVPDVVPLYLAERAACEGMGVLHKIEPPTILAKPKKRAPKNKAFRVAPENKQVVV